MPVVQLQRRGCLCSVNFALDSRSHLQNCSTNGFPFLMTRLRVDKENCYPYSAGSPGYTSIFCGLALILYSLLDHGWLFGLD
jgi:hypothetical protein